MRHFNSLGEFAVALIEVEIEVREALEKGLERVARKIEATAKAEIGTYQDEAGGFPAWPELAEATKDDRVKQGFTENDPLLRTGDLQESIAHEVEYPEAMIGSTDERMPWFEFGTSRMPARPVMGPAAFRNKDAIQKLVGAAVMAGLVGADQVHAALGYDWATRD